MWFKKLFNKKEFDKKDVMGYYEDTCADYDYYDW